MITSLITSLYLLGYVPALHASNFLLVSGVMLILADFAFGLFWIVGFNGLLSLYVGYAIRTGDHSIMGVPIDWGILFGISFIEFAIVAAVILILLRNRQDKISTGAEGMIGQSARIVDWSGTKGQVRVQGELWLAKSDRPMDLAADEDVTVDAVEGLVVKIKLKI